MADAIWLVWTNKHGSWWGPNHHGYTRRIEEAGRYTRVAVDAICNAWCPPGEEKVAVRAPEGETGE